MAGNGIYANRRTMGEDPENYVPGKFHPVHLGDVLNGRYHVFRKVGVGSQSTVWLARDKSSPRRRFVAIKVFGAKFSENELRLDKILRSLPSAPRHPGEHNVELALDSFMANGPNGRHFCKVLEPLGRSLSSVLESAFDRRAKLNAPQSWLGKAVDGDGWSSQVAKRACQQILLGLDYLHSQRIAHRDIQPGNVCVALRCDLSSLSENEIQMAVWPARGEAVVDADQNNEITTTKPLGNTSQSSKTSSDSDDDGTEEEWQREFEAGKKWSDEQWQAFEAGDELAEPHSAEWNKANFLNSRPSIELLRRRDGRPPQPDEIRYTVAATPLSNDDAAGDASSHLLGTDGKPFRLVLVDLGFACAFDECEYHPLRNLSDFRPPEALLGLPATHKADIFSAGLLFWEVVMLRRLVETRFSSDDDPDRTRQKSRLLRDLAQRLGPVPTVPIRAHWRDANDYVDAGGNALDMQERDGDVYEPGDFEWGDIWDQAGRRRPLDMDDADMERFVRLILEMLRWEPEARPSTRELLRHQWFKEA